jgi:hypothetical protein
MQPHAIYTAGKDDVSDSHFSTLITMKRSRLLNGIFR